MTGPALPDASASPDPIRRSPRRWVRVLAPLGTVALAFGGFAVAQAATGQSGTDSARDLVERAPASTSTTSTSVPDGDRSGDGGNPPGRAEPGIVLVADAIPDGTARTFAAGPAGTVTIGRNGATLTLVSSTVNPGWTREVEADAGPEVEVKFESATTRVDVEAELEDGGVRVRARERSLLDDDDAAPLPGPGSGPGRGDDDSSEREDSGPGSSDDDSDDNSGRGSDDDSDDNSGRGSGDDERDDENDDDGGDRSGSSSERD